VGSCTEEEKLSMEMCMWMLLKMLFSADFIVSAD
jgi:hypothetical protein